MRGGFFTACLRPRTRRLVSLGVIWVGLIGSLLMMMGIGMTAFANKQKPEWSHE